MFLPLAAGSGSANQPPAFSLSAGAPAGLPGGGTVVSDGLAYTVSTPQGPFYVWAPADYDVATAAVVYYVHGYNRTVDSSWIRGALPAQFHASARNALFIAPEAPIDTNAPLTFPRLADLEASVRAAGFTLPTGPRVAIGHSGAYRLVASWLGQATFSRVILLDALYGGDETFAKYATTGRLVLVSRCTARQAQAFTRRFPDARGRADVPATAEAFTPAERDARLLTFGTHLDHAGINDSGQVMPVLLQLAI